MVPNSTGSVRRLSVARAQDVGDSLEIAGWNARNQPGNRELETEYDLNAAAVDEDAAIEWSLDEVVDPEVEAIAVEVAKTYEAGQGRKPISVEEENCGWDLTSLVGGEVARSIEVKGRAGVGGVALTPNEWIQAQRFGDQYWLDVVVHCKTKPELNVIQNPTAKLVPREEVRVVRYVVAQGEWRKAAVAGSSVEGPQEVGS